MCSKDEAEKIIEEKLDKERLKKIIIKTSVVAWGNVITEKEIDKWLENFTGLYFSSIEIEQRVALWLLAHFTYYSNNDVRVLCKDLFNLILHQKLLENGSEKSFDEILDELLTESVFIGLGNDSESGKSILYYFRQENKLSKKSFEFSTEKKYKNIVYIDDVSMSGSQAIEYTKAHNLEAENIYAGFLIATEYANNRIEKSGLGITPIATMVLDERDRAFSDDSFVFSDKQVHDLCSYAKEFCKEYGEMAVEDEEYLSDCPLGFCDGQYLIGFEYNTPDNTLPIFWGTSNGWKPLFKRHAKIYGSGKESAKDGRKYY